VHHLLSQHGEIKVQRKKDLDHLEKKKVFKKMFALLCSHWPFLGSIAASQPHHTTVPMSRLKRFSVVVAVVAAAAILN